MKVSPKMLQNVGRFFSYKAGGNNFSLFESQQKKLTQIPKLELIENIISAVKKNPLQDLNKTYLVIVQHMLKTTPTLIKALLDIGFTHKNVRIIGKPYSHNDLVKKQLLDLDINVEETVEVDRVGEYSEKMHNAMEVMWNKVNIDIKNNPIIEKVIIVDEGGRAIDTISNDILFKYNVIGIEQTRGGLYSPSVQSGRLQVVEVASSALKRHFESPLIAEVAVKKMNHLIDRLNLNREIIFGIIGNGYIGSALAKNLNKLGFFINIYDKNIKPNIKIMNEEKMIYTNNIQDIILGSDCIIGCTGTDCLREVNILDLIKRNKIFISFSSEDKEFYSLLNLIKPLYGVNTNLGLKISPFDDLTVFTNDRSKILIISGGYPANFDNSGVSVENEKIALTGGLMLGAILQAQSLEKKPFSMVKKNLMLDPNYQKAIGTSWIKSGADGYQFTDIEESNIYNLEWITHHSGGYYENNSFMELIASNLTNMEEEIIEENINFS